MVLFGDNKAEPVPNKTDLIEKEGSFVDEFGSITITIWNKQIETGEEGLYEIKNIRLWQFKGEKYISAVTDTAFNKLTENLPLIAQRKIKDTKEEIKTNKITCDHIQSVNITVFYNSVESAEKSNFNKDKLMLGFRNCRWRFLIKNSTKTTTAHVSVKKKLCKQYGIHYFFL